MSSFEHAAGAASLWADIKLLISLMHYLTYVTLATALPNSFTYASIYKLTPRSRHQPFLDLQISVDPATLVTSLKPHKEQAQR
jgi:hypothetical protein